jgi:hypothetical protein
MFGTPEGGKLRKLQDVLLMALSMQNSARWEGATKFVEVVVKEPFPKMPKAAMAIANSLLVKTAFGQMPIGEEYWRQSVIPERRLTRSRSALVRQR